MSYTIEAQSIFSLKSIKTVEEIQALQSLGIHSIRDLAEYTPCRYAEILVGFIENGNVDDLNLKEYLDDAYVDDLEDKKTILTASVLYIQGIGETWKEILESVFEVKTIEELARFNPFVEAKAFINNQIKDTFYEKPSAPDELIPKIIGSTHTKVRYSNYIKEKEHLIKGTGLVYYDEKDEPNPESEILNSFYRSNFKFHLGYLAAFKQKWINAGTHLGEIIHSLALAPGESRNIAFVEWQSQQTSSRSEDTEAGEVLTSEFNQNRALNEVVVTTAKEHLMGSTEIDATTKTTGYGLTAGFGTGASAGASGKADLSAIVGFPLQVAGAGLASAAGSTGGSIVHSKSTTQGTLVAETSGERTVTGEVTQNIADSTVQNSSNIRSLMSTVVVEDQQSGEQHAQSRNVTNYNHSHALTMQYYEVLQKYNTKTFTDSLTPVLYLPFKPINFDIELIQKYWILFSVQLQEILPKAKFEVYDQVIKDFDSTNGAFDSSGDVKIEKIRISRSRSYSQEVRVELIDANPSVTIKIDKTDMDKCLDFIMKGSSEYINYQFLKSSNQTLEKDSFDGKSSFEIDENVTAEIQSDFKSELKKQLKWYLESDSGKTKKVAEINREDNELGVGNKRKHLIQDVDEDRFRILNGSESVSFSFNIDYDLVDSAGNTQTVSQTYSDDLTYETLDDGYDEEIFNVTDHVNSQLLNVSDINPLDIMEEIESHFQTYKYGYTKYLLNYIEKEQLIDVIEHLNIDASSYSRPLTDIIDPNPLGMVENLLIFKLKESLEDEESASAVERFTFFAKQTVGKKNESSITISGDGTKTEVVYQGKKAILYILKTDSDDWTGSGNSTSYELSLLVMKKAGPNKKHAFHGKFVSKVKYGQQVNTSSREISGYVNKAEGKSLTFDFSIMMGVISTHNDNQTGSMNEVPAKLKVDFEFKKIEKETTVVDIINNYISDLREYEEEIKKEVVKDTVFLPTAGVFGEAILGISNASEYINIRRFYNWQDSPIPNSAPAFADVDVNQNYSKEISDSINPNIPVSVLNQISPQQMPDTNLGNALNAVQNGNMFRDMSKTEHLAGTLKELSALANNTAQLAGTLAGEAAANALNAAVELGKQVAGMVNTAMGTNVASPPQTQTAKGAIPNLYEEMGTNPDGSVSPKDNAVAGAVGAPIGGSGSGGSGLSGGNPSSGSGGQSGGSGGTSSGGTGSQSGSGTTTNPTDLGLKIAVDNFDYDSDDIGQIALSWLKGLVPDDVAQVKDIADILDLINEHIQYGGNFKIQGRLRLTSQSNVSTRDFRMDANSFAIILTKPAGMASAWHRFYLDDAITDLESINHDHYDVAFLSGDVSEVLAILTDLNPQLSAMISFIDGLATIPDISHLPQWMQDIINANTYLSYFSDFIAALQRLIDFTNQAIIFIENDLQVAGLYIRRKGDYSWTFVGEANRTIGTAFITTLGTNNDMQMDLTVE